MKKDLSRNASRAARDPSSQSASSIQITQSLAASDPAFERGLICQVMRASLISHSVWYHFPSSNKRKKRQKKELDVLFFFNSFIIIVRNLRPFSSRLWIRGVFFPPFLYFFRTKHWTKFDIMEAKLSSGWEGNFWYPGTLINTLIHS